MKPNYNQRKNKNRPNSGYPQQPEVVTRARTPYGNEVIGIVEQRVGANRMIVKCFDDKSRNCGFVQEIQ